MDRIFFNVLSFLIRAASWSLPLTWRVSVNSICPRSKSWVFMDSILVAELVMAEAMVASRPGSSEARIFMSVENSLSNSWCQFTGKH